MYKESLYKQDIAILKSYSGKCSKITLFKTLRTSGLDYEDKRFSEKGTINEEKLENNISRARSKIFEYSLCNDWKLFATFTVSPDKYNRQDLEKYHSDLSQFIRDYNKKHKTEIKYLLIPEEHKKKGWHEHGLIIGLLPSYLRQFTLQEKLPVYIRDKLKQGQIVYDWTEYREKFGWCDLEPIRSQEAISKYITKYITKTLSTSIKKLNAHLYYCSKGLATAEEIKRGTMLHNIMPTYENEYVKIQWFDGTISLDTLAQLIENKQDYNNSECRESQQIGK